MKNLFYMAMVALAMTTFFSCEEDKKSTELLKKSTEIAKQRTDSFRIVQKDSIEKAMARERRRGNRRPNHRPTPEVPVGEIS